MSTDGEVVVPKKLSGMIKRRREASERILGACARRLAKALGVPVTELLG
jgi:hypothetical protein